MPNNMPGGSGSGKRPRTSINYTVSSSSALGEIDDEEARLSSLVFGAPVMEASSSNARAGGESATAASSSSRSKRGDGKGYRSKGASAAASEERKEVDAVSDTEAAAWHDDDDDALAVDLGLVSRLRKLRSDPSERTAGGKDVEKRLRERFKKTSGGGGGGGGKRGGGGGGGWATVEAPNPRESRSRARRIAQSADADDGEDDEEEGEGEEEEEAALLASTTGILRSKRGGRASSSMSLSSFGAGAPPAPDKLSVLRVRDANRSDPSKAVIQSASFHPSGSVLLTAGLDKTLRFFSIDGKANARLAAVHFEDMPIVNALWAGEEGGQVLVTGRRPFFHVYDVAEGRTQRVRILGRDEKSLESSFVQPQQPRDHLTTSASAAYSSLSTPSLFGFLGADGAVILVSQETHTWVNTLKMNGSVRAATFAPPPYGTSGAGFHDVLATGSDGEVYRWDLRTMKCIQRHVDEGSTGGLAIAASNDGLTYAVGASSGVVNIYSTASVGGSGGGGGRGGAAAASSSSASGTGQLRDIFASATTPKPLSTCLSLTTGVSTLSYSHDGAILALASQRIKDSLRLLHVPTGKVYSNWPTQRTPLSYVTALSFSPRSGYFSVGNDKGRVLLYRLNHYDEA